MFWFDTNLYSLGFVLTPKISKNKHPENRGFEKFSLFLNLFLANFVPTRPAGGYH